MIRRTTIVLLTLLGSLTACAFSRAEPDTAEQSNPPHAQQFDRSLVFRAGDGGYQHYRIPALAVTKAGTLLALCEARSGGDWSAIDIVLRRSTDRGATWSDVAKLADVPGPHAKNPALKSSKSVKPGEVTYNNPLVIADPKTGAVHLLFCYEYARCFHRRSDDDGATFSPAVEITSAFASFRDDYSWKVLAVGPGHGIQLTSGRLIVPVWLSSAASANAHHPSVIATIHSDDQGANWQRGAIVAGEREPLVDPSESEAVELADGRVLLNIRSEATPNRRAVAISPDGISAWSVPRFDEALVEPICMASICRLSQTPGSDRNRLLFSNPANLGKAKGEALPGKSRDRRNLTIRLSYDEARTWPAARVVEAGASGYSDLAVAPDGTIYCLYETRGDNARHSIWLARFNLEWLTEGQDALPK